MIDDVAIGKLTCDFDKMNIQQYTSALTQNKPFHVSKFKLLAYTQRGFFSISSKWYFNYGVHYTSIVL